MDKMLDPSDASVQYVILAHPSYKVIDTARAYLVSEGYHPLNISSLISNNVSPTETKIASAFQSTIEREINSSPHPNLLLHSIDFLFHPTFKLDPFLMLRAIAKRRRIVLLWPGTFSDNSLTYSIPEHNHFRIWNFPPYELNNPVFTVIKNLKEY